MKTNLRFNIVKFFFLFAVLFSSFITVAGTTAAKPTCANPAISPANNSYFANNETVTVTLTCATSGALIYYTTDGSSPSSSSTKKLYNSNSPFTITGASGTKSIKAIAILSGYNNSSIVTATYTFAAPAVTPTFSPIPGSYTTTQSVSLSSGTSGATIRYTVDGTQPDLSSPIYGSAIPISVPTTINAMAVKSGLPNSAIAVGTYSVLLPVAAPSFSLNGGNFIGSQQVSISSSTTGASIYYTTNGSDPTTSSTYYSGGNLTVDASQTLKAIAVKNLMSNSTITSASYVIKCANPTFSPGPATYTTFQTVSLGCTTSGATIRYTTDGSDPSTTNGTIYSGSFPVNATLLVKAIAYKTGTSNSDVTSGNYTIQLIKVSNPVLSVAQGTYNAFQSVSITCPTGSATIMYTTDGSDASPTNGTVYTAPIAVNASTVIKTMAFVYGMANSDLVTGSYVIQLLPVDAPAFNPQAGAYEGDQVVAIATTTTGCTIHYTTDGSTPTETDGNEYTGPITVSTNTNFRAIAFKRGMNDSPISTSNCIIKVAKPQFSPTPGNYSTFQSVSLSTTTTGATIKYTTDGSTPSKTNGTVYTTPIAVNSSVTIKAIAYKVGKTDSDIASGTYNITLLKVATPTFSPASGTYNTYQSVTLACATSGATIKYTTDGSTPSQTNGTVYSAAIPIQVTTNLKAIAYSFGMTDSDVATSIYTIQLLSVATPTFSPTAGTFNAAQSITIASSTSGALVYYTTDGTTPTTSSNLYASAVTVSANTTLNAIAVKSGMNNSAVSSAGYVINCVTPVLSPATGTYNAVQNVSMSTTTSGATIYYTIDGSVPTIASAVYSTAVTVGANSTLKAIAIKTGMGNSAVASEAYIILLPVMAPAFSPVAGTYNSPQSVTITSATSGASIRYTTDGSTPSDVTGAAYSGAVSISNNVTLKAIAYKSGMSNSAVTSGGYVINCATPVLTPATGSYTSVQSVAITSATPGALIYYTTDGSTPTTSSTLYGSAISVGTNMTIKAIATNTGMGNSGVASEAYTILLPVAAPTFTPAAGTYFAVQSVAIASATSGADFYYTLDGTDPTTSSPHYTGPVSVASSQTLKAIGIKSGMSASPVTSGVYTILLPAAAPQFSPVAGTYIAAQSVAITSPTTGGDTKIYYTTNGSDPTTSSTLYSSAISIAANTTLKAVTVKTGMSNSPVTSAVYVIKCATPQFSPAPGGFNTFQSVTLSTTTSGATIKYTTDGSQPSQTNGTVYTTAISVTSTTTIRAIAYQTGLADSDVGTGTYTITLLKVATPTISLAAGTYNTFQSVTLSSTTSGATIRYTTDGSTPSQTNGTVYSAAIPVQVSTNLKVFAYKLGMTDSDVASAAYTIQLLDVAAPAYTPAGGTYDTPQSVTITSTTSGAAIYYTTDGTTPTTSSNAYSGAISVSANTTLKAIAVKSEMNNSSIITASYVINCATPILSPVGGTFTNSQSVSMSTTTSGASIYYTTNGNPPSTSSTLYTGAVSVGANTTIRAIAVKNNMGNSSETSQVYTILIPVTQPIFTPAAGTYNSAQSVTISTSISGASVRYTTDGSTPSDVVGTVYTSPVSISNNTTLKAIAYMAGMSNSAVTSGDYVINCATPVLTPATGSYTSVQSVTISSTTPGALIYYTTDGSAPTTSGSLYNGTISVGTNMTIKALAVKTGMGNSGVASEAYTILLPVAAPTFTPAAGTYFAVQSVTIASATSGADFYYTLDGTDPTTSSPHYTGPVSVASSQTLKAIGIKSGMSASPVTSGVYTILLPAAAPQFSPVAGTYTTAQSVAITSTTTGGDTKIYYTNDGSDPTTSSTLYSSAIFIAANNTLKAITVKTGMSNSPVTSAVYVIKCATPQFSPAPGGFNTFQSVTLSTTTSGATIKYTTDGSQPSQTNGTVYTTAISVTSTTTIRAITYQTGLADSDVGTGTYTITLLKVATPTISLAAGTYNTFQSVTLSSTTSGATIRYTTDGSTPSQTNGTVYSAAIPVQVSTNLKVFAYKVGMTDSDVASAAYTIQLLDVAAPAFSPVAGTYSSSQNVAITSTTSGAAIYYTTDGSDPTISSSLYSAAINVASNATLKAIAVKSEMNNSSISTANYVISCATPILTPAGNTFTSVQSVSMSTTTSGANIYFTTDGSAPSVSSTLYTVPLSVGVNTTIKAVAIKSDMGNSAVASQDYVILIPVTAPFFTPSAGIYSSTQSVIIATTIDGASIRYTTDGSTPSDVVGTLYTAPVSISNNTTIKAIAYKAGMSNSTVTSGSYVINCITPVITPATGTYNTVQSVTITSATPGALIYYTTDGTAPTASGTLYNGAISVGTNMTIKAIAVKTGMGNSGVASEAYTILLPVAAPSFTPAAGSFTSVQTVTIATTTLGADIYYTLDGNDPTTSSPHYVAPVSIASNATLKAIAVKPDMSPSPVTSGVYTILLPAAAPQFSPIPGSYTTTQSVTITSLTTGANAKIYYTLDGTDPTASSTLYSGPVQITANATLKAITVNTGMSNSPITTGGYVIYPKANDPTFLPTPGTYIGSQNVTMASTSVGAKIHFTTDGTNPSELVGTEYSGPVTIAVNTSFKAIAYGTIFANSNITSVVYSIKVASPVLSVLPGNYSLPQNLVITCSTDGAKIYYTTDGTTPSATNGTLYTTGIDIGINRTTIQTIAIKTGMTDSDPVSATYVVNLGKVVLPVFTPAAGTYVGTQTVAITSETVGTTIKYTLDGTDPGTTNGTIYTAPVSVSVSGTLKAIATKTNMIDSDIASGIYKIKPDVVTFTPAPGNYTSVQSIVLACVTPGVTIKYTIDGTNPGKTNGVEYTTPILLASNKTLKAMAYKTGLEDGDIVSGDYLFQLTQVVKPVYTPVPGSYTTPQSVTLSTATSGATIRYTMDGTAPSKTVGSIYTDPIVISTNTTINMIAYKTGLDDSEVVSGSYTITLGSSDYDADGVSDKEDDYPTDPKLAFDNYYPGIGYGSIAFEDNWPFKADYDMNDMVIDYRFNQITNAQNQVVQLKAKLVVRAMGASFHNGFGIELPVTPSQVSSCVVTLKNGNPVPMVGNIVTIDPATGLEANQTKAVVILFDDGYNVLVQKYAGIGVNTTQGVPFTIPDTLLMTIAFKQPVSPDVLSNEIFNPFIFTNKKRGNEIHLPDFAPTSLADMSLFKTGDDKSDPANGKYYKTAGNLPWALNIYEGYQYPYEKVSILDAFKHFAEWAGSSGVLYPDWYKDLSGYRNTDKIYVP